MKALLAGPALLWLAVAFAAPLAVVMLLSLQADADMFAPLSLRPSLAQFDLLTQDGYYLRTLAGTLVLSAAVAAICAVLGYPLAAWLARLDARWRSLALALVLVPLFTNVVVRTLGILTLLSPNGPFGFLGVNMLFGWFAVGLALVQVFLPFMVLALMDSLQSQRGRLAEAAQSLGAGPAGRFLAVTLPLSLPGLRSGLVMVFLMTATSFVSATILGGRKIWVVGMSVYQEALQNLNYPLAAALSVTLTLATLAIAWAIGRAVMALMPWATLRPRRAPWTVPAPLLAVLDRAGPAVAGVLTLVALGLLLFPLVLVAIGSVNASELGASAVFRGFTWRWYRLVFANPEYIDAFLLSLRLALVSVVIAILLTLPASFAVARHGGRGIEAALLLPLALPGLAVGIGMLRLLQWFVAVPPFAGLAAVHVVLVIPFTLALLKAAVGRLDRSLEDAAAGLGAGPVRRFLFVMLPQLAPGLMVAGIIGFLISFGEVTVTAFLTTARFQTLPVRIYAEATFSLQNTVNAVSTLIILGTCALLFVVNTLIPLDRIRGG
jgi:putative spermidine/putrescine transport system permease protein